MKAAQLSIHACVGVIQNPSRGILYGQPTWTCQLLLTQCGKSALKSDCGSNYLVSQETLQLRCRGFSVAQYCGVSLLHGDVAHVVAKLLQRPRYSPEHTMYFNDTELLVTDSFGCIQLVKRM